VPARLAREVATTDVLTGGRLELGLGAGHMTWEFDHAGIDWEPFGARTQRLRATIEQLRRELATDGYAQQTPLRDEFGIPVLRPVQRRGFGGHGPPLIVGGTGDRVPRIATDAETDERVRYASECAGIAPGASNGTP
jgi:alkanesulfonate monooxygenase SsuD/methylene tetrahydromethanopterin reductase-like flavin-dependent oxidoreductase (luciferase family)